MDELLVVHPGERLAPGVEIAALGELNHVVDMFANFLGSGSGGRDSAVADGFGGQAAKQGLALVGGKAQLFEPLAMANHGDFCRGRSSRAAHRGLKRRLGHEGVGRHRHEC